MSHTLFRVLAFSIFLAAAVIPLRYAFGQEGLSLTVTPPLFQLTIGPGESWASGIKVVNNNPYDVTYYAHVVNFDAEGEGGKSTFTPLIAGEDNSGTLAGWVTLDAKPVFVRAGESTQVPFSVRIPTDAPPGGHYAAILIGTQPGDEAITGPSLKVSSLVSSLLFVRVKGDVQETGRIREFSTRASVYSSAKADFALRFENTGNTHLKPQGEVMVYNMWGKERGKILINQASNFGNVLPESVRKFEFIWEGANDSFDIGRYRAEATLGFGEEGRQSAIATTYFWVVPVVPVATTLGSVFGLIVALVWFIRRYIRSALLIEQERLGLSSLPRATLSTFFEPLREGVVDLRIATGRTTPKTAEIFTFGVFLRKYKSFFIFLVFLVVLGALLMTFFSSVMTPNRPFEVTEVSTGEEWRE